MIQTNESQVQPLKWDIFDDWYSISQVAQVSPDWNAVDDILYAFADVYESFYSQLTELLDKWDRLLVEFGGDPTHQDWRRFRPLRLSREEDWSDWLAYLVESSVSGTFSCISLGDVISNRLVYASPTKTDREVTSNDFRADVIVQWSNATYTHIEVKVGDRSLSKTFLTSRMMRERYHQPVECWTNYILLPSQQIPEWEAIDHKVPGEPPIKAITWESVCIALRQGLQSNEKISWKVFAYSMIGAIEQFLIEYSGHDFKNRPVENVETKIWILREGLIHG